MYYVYIIRSKVDGSFYTGMTKNLKKRIQSHNSKENKYSSRKAPFELVWYCAFENQEKALSLEKYLKSGSGFAFARKRLV